MAHGSLSRCPRGQSPPRIPPRTWSEPSRPGRHRGPLLAPLASAVLICSDTPRPGDETHLLAFRTTPLFTDFVDLRETDLLTRAVRRRPWETEGPSILVATVVAIHSRFRGPERTRTATAHNTYGRQEGLSVGPQQSLGTIPPVPFPRLPPSPPSPCAPDITCTKTQRPYLSSKKPWPRRSPGHFEIFPGYDSRASHGP